MTTFHVGQSVWIAYTLAKFPAVVTEYTASDGYSQGQVKVKEINDPSQGYHGADLGNYPDNVVFDHEPVKVQETDDHGTYTVWQ